MNTFWKTLIFFIFKALILCSSLEKRGIEMQHFLKILEPDNLLKMYSNEKNLERENNSMCLNDISHVINELENITVNIDSIWALKMLDSSTKIPSGLLAGNIVDLGMYDECTTVSKVIDKKLIEGRHCLYSFRVKKIPASMTFSICIPSSCGAQDIKYIFKQINKKLNETDLLKNWNFEDVSATCSSVGNRKITVGTIITVIVLSTIVLFLTLCTAIDWLYTRKIISYENWKILAKFSLYKSTMQIFNTKHKVASFPALHGIRTLSIFWIIYGHTFTSRLFTPFVNTIDKYKWLSEPNSLYIFLAPFAVDTFFVISGFLMTYLVLKELESGKKFNIFMYYFHRYLRLTPVIVILLLIALFILPHLGSGPLWETALEKKLTHTCEEKWWTLLIYVQNYVRTDIECLGHTWYLAADMQFYWLSPFILIPLAKKPKLGLIILGFLFLLSLVVVGTLIATNKYVSTLYSHGVPLDLVASSFRFFYTVSHTRASSWIIGILLGYIVYLKPNFLSKKNAVIGWVGATGCFVFCIIGQRIALAETYEYSTSFETTFGMFSRPIWAIGVSWVIFSSIYGYGGPMTRFLSLPIFAPLSRISYCVYVVHATFQISSVNTLKTADYFSENHMFLYFLSELSVTLVLAFLLSIFIESPVMVLEKIMLKRKGSHLKSQNLQDVEISSKNKKMFI